MSQDSNRTKIWFPLFSYFESSVDGIVPNEYNSVLELLKKLTGWIIALKDLIMLNARRFWDPLRKKDDQFERSELIGNFKSHSNVPSSRLNSSVTYQRPHNGSGRTLKSQRRKLEQHE